MSNADRPASDTILVLSDSLAYYGPKGGLPADHPQIWPNLLGAQLDMPVELIGRIGWTSRDVWWALTQDPRVWAAVPRAAVVILAFTGMDSLPSPLPTVFREGIRYLRPEPLRSRVRDGYAWLQPRLAPLGWPMALPPRVSVEYLEKIRDALIQIRPELPIIACLPPVHNSPYYGNVHPGYPKTVSAVTAWAEAKALPLVDLAPPTRVCFSEPGHNPDGIHWSIDTHRAVADIFAPVVAESVRTLSVEP